MFGVDGSIINGTVPENIVHFRPYISFHWTDVPESSYLILQTQTIENYHLYWCVVSTKDTTLVGRISGAVRSGRGSDVVT